MTTILFKGIPRLLFILLSCFLYYLPEGVFRCLPLSFKAPIRHVRRVAVKTGMGVEQAVELTFHELKTDMEMKRTDVSRYRGDQGSDSPLSKFLGIYDMLLLVTQELHYLDIVNLARVSKSVRESVLPSHDFERRRVVFKMYTCLDGGSKKCCWTCTNQICEVMTLPSRCTRPCSNIVTGL